MSHLPRRTNVEMEAQRGRWVVPRYGNASRTGLLGCSACALSAAPYWTQASGTGSSEQVQSCTGIGREEQGRNPCARPAGSAVRTEGGGGEAWGPPLRQPGGRSWENVPQSGEWAHNLQTLEGEASPRIMASCLIIVSHQPPPLSIPSPGLGPTLGTASFRALSAFPLFSQGPLQLPPNSQSTQRVNGEAAESQDPCHPLQRPPFPCLICQRNLHGSGYSGKLYLPSVMAFFSPSASEGQGGWGQE